MKPSLVSILIPAYNSEKYIGECIESALNQTYHNREIIVIDDGSTDKTLEIAKSYKSSVVRIIHQDNKGQCGASNRAFYESKGELIKFFDADDLVHSALADFEHNLSVYSPWNNARHCADELIARTANKLIIFHEAC